MHVHADVRTMMIYNPMRTEQNSERSKKPSWFFKLLVSHENDYKSGVFFAFIDNVRRMSRETRRCGAEIGF
jgi:hypothetical protein